MTLPSSADKVEQDCIGWQKHRWSLSITEGVVVVATTQCGSRCEAADVGLGDYLEYLEMAEVPVLVRMATDCPADDTEDNGVPTGPPQRMRATTQAPTTSLMAPPVGSALYGAACRIHKPHGYRKVCTYTLLTEPGTSLRAAGWKPVAVTDGGSWDRTKRARTDKHPTEPKIRWECRCSELPEISIGGEHD